MIIISSVGGSRIARNLAFVGLLLGVALPLSTSAQTDIGALPRVSAPGAYGDSPTTGITASSSTYRNLAPPPGIAGEGSDGLSVNIGIGAARHSNPQRLENGGQSDEAVVISPSISYGGELGRHLYEIGYDQGSKRYGDFDTEDSEYKRLAAALRLDLTRILIADLYANRVEGTEVRGSSGARIIDGSLDQDEYTADTLGGRVTLGRRSNLLQMYVGAEMRDLDYTNNNQSFRDRDEDMVEGGLFFNVGASTALFLHVKERQIDYLVGNPSLDSTETSLTAGVTWEASEAISLLLEAGNLEKDFDDPAIAGYDGSTYLVKLTWSPRDRTRMSLYGSRTTEESADPAAPFYLSDVTGIDLTQRLGDRGSVSVYYALADDEYSNGRRDETTDWGVSLGFSARTWLDLGLAYNVIDKESNIPNGSFEDEIISVFVNLKPRIGGN